MFASRREASLKKASLSQSPPSGRGGGGVARQFRLAEEAFGRLVGRVEFTAHVQSNPSPVMRLHALGDVCALGHESLGLRNGRLRLFGGETFRPGHRLAV